jgi:hypothetical protein
MSAFDDDPAIEMCPAEKKTMVIMIFELDNLCNNKKFLQNLCGES